MRIKLPIISALFALAILSNGANAAPNIQVPLNKFPGSFQTVGK
jgi:hypothetical protein